MPGSLKGYAEPLDVCIAQGDFNIINTLLSKEVLTPDM